MIADICRSPRVKYARIWVFPDTYAPVQGKNRKFCPYTGKYGSEETRNLHFFTQWIGHELSEINLFLFHKV